MTGSVTACSFVNNPDMTGVSCYGNPNTLKKERQATLDQAMTHEQQQQLNNVAVRISGTGIEWHGRSLVVTVWEDEPSRLMLKSQK